MPFSYHLPILILSLALTAVADDPPCPEASEIVYSPFTPYFHWYKGDRAYYCWTAAICTLGYADEARKQQFGATALVMGLLPLTVRDIAWPERRIVLVSAPLPAFPAIIVRALGLDPMVKGEVVGWREGDVQRWMEWARDSWIAGSGLRSQRKMKLLIGMSFIGLLISYAALALVEVYSKGSALGCTYPVTLVTWCILALIPAGIHVGFEGWRRRKEQERVRSLRASAVQGADEAWMVQLAWAIYYIAGTLAYTSIMAVTPIELFVWVVVQLVVTAVSKLLALYICLYLRNPVVGY